MRRLLSSKGVRFLAQKLGVFRSDRLRLYDTQNGFSWLYVCGSCQPSIKCDWVFYLVNVSDNAPLIVTATRRAIESAANFGPSAS